MRFPLVSAVAGALAWVALVATSDGPFAFVSLFLLSPLVLLPLALAHLETRDRSGRALRLVRLAVIGQPIAAAALVVSFMRPPGSAAALFAGPWLALTVLLAIHGASRLLARGAGPPEELLIDAGLVYVAIGGAWLVASRAGISPLGFGEPTVLLTAIHFHVAAFALPIFAGAAGRAFLPARGEPAFRIAAIGLVAGPILLALGIVLSRRVEVAAAVTLAASLLLFLAWASFAAEGAARAVFVALACGALASMSAAVFFASDHTLVDLATMARFHGAVNAMIVASGLLALLVVRPASGPRGPRAGAPFSRLRSRARTGPDYFVRQGLVDDARSPRGLTDDLAAYARDGFDPEAVDEGVRRFYERTAEYDLRVVPRWSPAFRPFARLYARYARRAGQMCLPLEATDDGLLVKSEILGVRDEADGREGVRAWVRTYADSGEPVYVAAYATHRERGVPYMNIAFPFPGWNLTSVLRLDNWRGSGVALTTLATPRTCGDQGVFAVGHRWHVRLPIDETIAVWRQDEATVAARHTVWVFGARAVELEYAIVRSDAA